MHRLATQADLDAVFAIYMDAEVIPYLGFDPMPRDDFMAVMHELVASQCFHVVEQAGRVVGFYRLSRPQGRARHVAHLATFAVAAEARGRGVGRNILDTVIARLHAEGVTRIELVVEADNPRALSFYRKLGFECEGRMRLAYQRANDPGPIDQFLMAKLLPPLAGPGSSV